ncbi:TPA: meta-pathway of phenol degradation family protein, partial [Neisseria gonorrhoeae]
MKRIFLPALPAILPLSVYADLPLTIEDIMTDKGKWKLETSLTYLNSENSRSELA